MDALKLDQAIRIEMNLSVHLKEEVINLLKEHWDVFTWIADKIVGVSPKLMLHRLNMDLRARSVKQKRDISDQNIARPSHQKSINYYRLR